MADALDKVNDRLSNFMSSTERQTLAINAQVQTISAWTLGQKLAAATASEMASLGIRQIRTSEELIAVQGKQAAIIAQANDKAFNLNRDATDQLSLAGLFGLDRQRAEIRLKARDYRDQLSDLSGGRDLEGIGSAFLPARTAVTGFSDALDLATRRLATFPGGAEAGAPISGLPAVGGRGAVTAPMMAVMQAYVDRGYSPAAAAGFVGGMTTESGINLDPTAINGTGHRGMAQWDATRWNQVRGFAGGAAWTREGQTAASLAELGSTESRSGRMLAGSSSVLGGVLASDAYERPGDAEAARRRPLALARGNALLDAYQGSVGAAAFTGVLGVKLDTASNISGWENKSLAAANINAGESIINSAQQALGQRAADFELLSRSVSMTSSALARYTEISRLQLQLDQAHVDISPKMRAEMAGLGDQAADLAQKQSDLQARQQLMGTIGSDLAEVSSSGVIGLINGKGMSGFSSALHGLGESLIRSAFGGIFGSIFGGGRGGSMFGGGGGILSSLFSIGGGGGGIGHNAQGTDDWRGGLTEVGEKGPELVELPAHAKVIPNDVLSSMRGRSSGPTFQFGDVHIHPVGGAQFTAEQIAGIRGEVKAGQQETADHLVRNWGQYQADASQTGQIR